MDNSEPSPSSTQKKKGFKAYLPIIVVVVVVIVAAIWWYVDYSKYIRSDDATIGGNSAEIASQIEGRIVKLYVQEGDSVKQNQLLAELDSKALLDKSNEVSAQIEEAIAGLAQVRANYKYNQEQLIIKELTLNLASKDYVRAQALYKGQAIPLEQLQESQISYETAKSEVESAKEIVAVGKAQIEKQIASINSAKTQRESIATQLSYTKIHSPNRGIVAKRWLMIGDVVSPAQTIYTISIDSTRWINANLEETKLRFIHLNQEAEITIDAYPKVTFSGRFIFIGSMAASQFSLIPASNASGNFTKVVQRIPIKVSIDKVLGNHKLSDYPLRIGMSAEIKATKK